MANKKIFNPGLRPGETVGNDQIMARFHCACEGGIRPANATDSIVLVLNHAKMDHSADWHGNVLWFRGAGAKGDQTLEKGRNRTLLAALEGARPVYLFEVFRPGQYTFRGRVRLAARPFAEDAPGSDSNLRKVWIFPLEIDSGAGEGVDRAANLD